MASIARMQIRRFRNTIARHGFVKTLEILPYAFRDMFRNLLRSWDRTRREGRAFDRHFGIITTSDVPLSALTVESKSVLLGRKYVASSIQILETVFSDLDIAHDQYTFIDFGSGMGRAAIYAARFPFRRVIGVEFAAELHAIAKENVHKLEKSTDLRSPIELYCIDATEFAFPGGNLVCFFFNPFAAPVMGTVISNLERSLIKEPRRECYLIYINPTAREAIDSHPLWKAEEKGSYLFYTFGFAPNGGN